MAKIIDGKAFAEGLRKRIAVAVSGLKGEHGLTPGLARANHAFEKKMMKALL